MTSIIYLTHAPRESQVYLTITEAIEKDFPEYAQICIDVAKGIFTSWPPEPEDETFINTSVKFLKLGLSSYIDNKIINVNIRYCQALENAFKDLKPDVVVIPFDEPGLYQVAVNIAKKLSIPSVVIQDAPKSFEKFGESMIKSVVMEDTVNTKKTPKEFINENLLLIYRMQKEILLRVMKLTTRSIKFLISYTSRRRNLDNEFFYCFPDNSKCFGQSGAIYIGVTGDYYKRKLVRLGVKEDQIEVIGYTRGDLLLRNKKFSDNRVHKELGLEHKTPFCLVLSQDFDNWNFTSRYHYIEAINDVCKIIQHIEPSMYKVILLHPGENVEIVRNRFKKEKMEKIIVRKGFPDYLSLYEASSMIVNFFSTTLVESMIIGKPIVTLDYILYDSFFPNLIEYGAVIPVLRREHLEDQIAKVFRDKQFVERTIQNQKLLLHDIFYHPDGKAGERAASLILKAIRLESNAQRSQS